MKGIRQIRKVCSSLVQPLVFSLRSNLVQSGLDSLLNIYDQIKACGPIVTMDRNLIDSANEDRPVLQRTVREFDGTQLVNTSEVIDFTQPWEVSMWMKSNDPPSNNLYIISTNNSLNGIRIATNGALTIRAGGFTNGVDALVNYLPPSQVLNTWQYYIFGFDGSNLYIELDGVRFNQPITTPSNVSGDRSIGLAGRHSNATFCFEGSLALVDINGTQFDFAENGGTTALNSADSTKHGTYVNAPAVVVDNTCPHDPLNELGFTEGNGSNGAAIGEYIVASTTQAGLDAIGNPLQWSGTVYPVLPKYRESFGKAFDGTQAMETTSRVSDSGQRTDISVSFYIKAGSNPLGYIVGEIKDNRGWGVRLQSGKISWFSYPTSGPEFTKFETVDVVVDSSKFVFVEVSYLNGGVSIYVDGEMMTLNDTSSGSPAPYIRDHNNPVIIGGKTVGSVNLIGELAGVIVDGKPYYLAESNGTTAYDSSGNDNHGTYVNAPATITQDVVHTHIEDGFSLYGHATLGDIYVPYANGSPLSITPPAGYTLTSEHPAVENGHNGAETKLDFYNVATDGGTTPAVVGSGVVLTDYSFGDVVANPMFKREVSVLAEDRHTLFADILEGACLGKANDFFSLNYLTDTQGNIQYDEQGNPQQEV